LIEINLLPGGTARRPAAGGRSLRMPSLPSVGGDPRITGLGLFAVVAFLGCAWLWYSLGQQHDDLQAQVDQAVADSTRMAKTIGLVHDLEARQDTIRDKIGIIRSVDQRRYVWPHILDEVSRAVPPYTWLTKLSSSEDAAAPAPAAAGAAPAAGAAGAAAAAPQGPHLTIEGNTASTTALTRFMKNLEASRMLRDVSLVTSSAATEQGRQFLKFTLEARYETPDSAAIRTVPLFVAR
jgi:Tfp pilus assembly protein PilN